MTQLGKTSLLDPGMAAAATPRSQPVSGRKANWRKLGMVALAVVSLGVLGFIVFRTVNTYQNSPNVQSKYRTLVDSETGEVFEDFRIPSASTFPIKNPKTGKATLYMGEPCYWTKDGKAKLKPTWVFARQIIGEPGPTICPDCGRRVTPHNAPPPEALMIEAAKAASK